MTPSEPPSDSRIATYGLPIRVSYVVNAARPRTMSKARFAASDTTMHSEHSSRPCWHRSATTNQLPDRHQRCDRHDEGCVGEDDHQAHLIPRLLHGLSSVGRQRLQ